MPEAAQHDLVLTTTKKKSLVGLDLGAGSIAATEVRVNGRPVVAGYGVASLPTGVYHEGEVTDAEALGDALKALFSERKLSRDVRLGIANQRVAVRTLFLPPIESAEELATAIRFRAQDEIPMPLEQAVLDWEVIGHRAGDTGERQVEVVVVAARRDMLDTHLEALQRAGLRPAGIDLSAFAMIRALADEDVDAVGAAGFVAAPAPSYEERMAAGPDAALPSADQGPAKLYCHLGDVVNLAVAQGRVCVFTRTSPFGVEGIAQKLAERRRLTLEHSRQWLVHVGLDRDPAQVDGDRELITAAREALEDGVRRLADELRLSLQYYGAQDHALAIEQVIACGPGSTIPGLAERLQSELGRPVAIGGPAPLEGIGDADRARLTVSYGLALEE
jgi:type IV pilus assembly protein PilM